MSEKRTETPDGAQPEPATQPTSIIQPMIDELKADSPPELPQDDEGAPPRGPVHPPQPVEHRHGGRGNPNDA
ncbi:MAG: hypothetical protein ACLPWF_05075 [Bryobacteraceae bacterium]